MKFLLVPIILMVLGVNAAAIGVDQDRLKDPAQEARAQYIMKQLRCLVCQNQSIVESDAGLAVDLRHIVREQISAGQSDDQIRAFMTSRYGDWVLLKPPFTLATALLWLSPLFLLMIGGFLVFRFIGQRPAGIIPAPLSPEEEERLKHILRDNNK